MFNWKKPTVEMLGRWQPWHDGHTALFKKALNKMIGAPKKALPKKPFNLA